MESSAYRLVRARFLNFGHEGLSCWVPWRGAAEPVGEEGSDGLVPSVPHRHGGESRVRGGRPQVVVVRAASPRLPRTTPPVCAASVTGTCGINSGRPLPSGLGDRRRGRSRFEIVKWFYIPVDDDTGYDAATEVMGGAVPGVRTARNGISAEVWPSGRTAYTPGSPTPGGCCWRAPRRPRLAAGNHRHPAAQDLRHAGPAHPHRPPPAPTAPRQLALGRGDQHGAAGTDHDPAAQLNTPTTPPTRISEKPADRQHPHAPHQNPTTSAAGNRTPP